jgi:cobalt-zinc-cadmium efflux system protein
MIMSPDSNNRNNPQPDSPVNGSTSSRLLLVTLMNLTISIIQVIGGVLSNSLSLLSDSFHNLGDTASLFISYLAGRISTNKPDFRKTFGYRRLEILAALFNGIVLIAICLYLFFEAFTRFREPESVDTGIMIPVAVAGFVINFGSMLILHKGQKKNINVKAAYIHLLSDSLTSLAVIAGSIIMSVSGIWWIDPLVSVLVGVFIIYHSWGIVKETVDILMQSTPAVIDIENLKKTIEESVDIDNIHHVHVWRLDDSLIHFEAHISLHSNLNMNEVMLCKAKVENILKTSFGISHTTLQFEYECCGYDELIVDDM